MHPFIERHLKERWQTEQGKAMKAFFIEHINQGEEGFLKIQEHWKIDNDFVQYPHLPNHYVKSHYDIDLRFIDLENVYFENAYFWDFNLTGANLKKATFHKCNIQGILLENSCLDEVVMTQVQSCLITVINTSMQNAQIKDCDFTQFDILKASLQGTTIENTAFTSSYWVDVEANQSYLKGVKVRLLKNNSFYRVVSERRISIQNANIIDCRFSCAGVYDLVDFSQSKIKNLQLEGSPFAENPTYHPILAHTINFSRVKINHMVFSHFNLTNIDLSESEIEDIHFHECYLKNMNTNNSHITNTHFENTITED